MMIEQATVIQYQDGIARVQCQAKSSCGGCVAQNHCGSKALSALAGEKFAPQFDLVVEMPLQVGDKVKIGLAERSLLEGVFWLYAVPLFVIVLSTLVLSQWLHNELWVAAGVLCTTAVTFLMIKRSVAQKSQAQFIPVFLGKV